MLRNSFSLKHLSIATGDFWACYGQSLTGFYLFVGVRSGYQKRFSENLIEYFSHSKNGMADCVSTQKFFNDFKFWDKRIVVHNKWFIKISGILLLIVKFVKSSDQTIIQIIRNKSVLMFLINPSNCFTVTLWGMYLKPLQHLKWRSLWYY